MEEIWKDIKGYEGMYQCSNLGRIQSLDRYVYEHTGKRQFRKGQIMKQRLNPNGYLQVPLNKNGKRKMLSVHIVVAQAFFVPNNSADIVNHKDGNKQNNKANNLEWISYSENNKHAYSNLNRKIVRVGGKRKPITIKDANDKVLYKFSSISEASKKIGLSHTQINRYINNNKLWNGSLKIVVDNTKCVEDSKMVS